MRSRAQIDGAGDRLKDDPTDLDAIQILFDYCLEVKHSTSDVISLIRQTTGSQITERAGKSFASIKAKLRRQKTKLSQIQDIEGCRILVDSPVEQDALVFRLRSVFPNYKIYDRRTDAAGYQAVHVVVRQGRARYEVQIRTLLQHAWAQVSEQLADLYGQGLKYLDYADIAFSMTHGEDDDTGEDNPQLTKLIETLASASFQVLLIERKERLLWQIYSGHFKGPAKIAWQEIDARFRLMAKLGLQVPDLDNEAVVADWLPRAHAEVQASKRDLRTTLLNMLDSQGEQES